MDEQEEIRLFIGARLREERERLGLSQTAFADLGAVSLRAEQDWERGVAAPRSDFLATVSSHGVDVLYILTGQRVPRAAATLTPDEAALVDNYQHSDEEGRAAARRVLSSLAKQKAA